MKSRARTKSPWRASSGLIALILFCCGCDQPPDEASSRELSEPLGQNLIIISIDTTRADAFGCYNEASRNITPNIDKLADQGIVFENAYTPVPVTLPAHSTLLTGLYPPSHGVRDNGIFVLDSANQTLAEHLSEQGFATGGFAGSKILDRRYGIGQGFDFYEQIPLEILDADDRENAQIVGQRSAEDVLSSATDWLSKQETNFFLFAHLYDPHAPYRPPEEYKARFEGSPFASYYGEIAYVDQAIQEFLGRVEAQGKLDNTLVLITADHGEGLGDKDEWTHGILIYQSTMRIPMVLFGGDLPRGRRVSQPIGLVDVVPTVLDCLGLPPLDPVQGSNFRGVVEEEIDLGQRALYLETLLPFYDMGWSRLEGMVFGDHKLIIAPTPELYDIGRDPVESTNLFDSDSALTETQLKVFDTLKTRLLDEAIGDAVPVELAAAEKAMLADLGYLDATGVLQDDTIDPKEHIEEAELSIGLGNKVSEGRYREAIEDCQRIFELNPKNTYAREQYASVYEGMMRDAKNRGDQATATRLAHKTIELYDDCLELQPDRVEVLYAKSMLLNSLGEFLKAQHSFEACVKAQPSFAPPHRWLGTLAEMRRESEAAIKHYEDFLRYWGDEGKIVEYVKGRLDALKKR